MLYMPTLSHLPLLTHALAFRRSLMDLYEVLADMRRTLYLVSQLV